MLGSYVRSISSIYYDSVPLVLWKVFRRLRWRFAGNVYDHLINSRIWTVTQHRNSLKSFWEEQTPPTKMNFVSTVGRS